MRAARAPLVVGVAFVCEGSACRKTRQAWPAGVAARFIISNITPQVGDQCVIYMMKKAQKLESARKRQFETSTVATLAITNDLGCQRLLQRYF